MKTPFDQKAYDKAYNKKHRVRISAQKSVYYKKFRSKVINFLGGICVKYGNNDFRVLQVDHINGGGVQELRKIGPKGIYNRVLNGEPGYQLLCANCNWIKRYENNENPRG